MGSLMAPQPQPRREAAKRARTAVLVNLAMVVEQANEQVRGLLVGWCAAVLLQQAGACTRCMPLLPLLRFGRTMCTAMRTCSPPPLRRTHTPRFSHTLPLSHTRRCCLPCTCLWGAPSPRRPLSWARSRSAVR